MADRDVDILAREVDVVERRADAEVDARVGLGEAAETVHQPLRGEIRRGRDGENAGALPLQQTFGPGGEAVEGVAHNLEIRAPRIGDDQPLALTVEEAKAEFGLKGLHLVADRALRDAQLVRCPGEALVASGGLEGLERVQRWKSSGHGTARVHEKNWGKLEKRCFARKLRVSLWKRLRALSDGPRVAREGEKCCALSLMLRPLWEVGREGHTWNPSWHHGRLMRVGGAAVRTVWFWMERSRQRRALAELDDRLLRDIGLTRDEARRESSSLFWKP